MFQFSTVGQSKQKLLICTRGIPTVLLALTASFCCMYLVRGFNYIWAIRQNKLRANRFGTLEISKKGILSELSQQPSGSIFNVELRKLIKKEEENQ